MSYTYLTRYKKIKEDLKKERKYFEELSGEIIDVEIIKEKVESIFKMHEEIIEMADDEIYDKDDEISDLEDNNRDLDDKVTDLEIELEEANEKISSRGETLEDHYKNELLDQLSQKYSLVKLSEVLKPIL